MNELKRIADSLEIIAECLSKQGQTQRQLIEDARKDAEKQKQEVMTNLAQMLGGLKHGD